MIKRWTAIVLAFLLVFLAGCSKTLETETVGSEAGEELKPFMITMTSGNREISLMEEFKGTFDKPFQLNYWFNGTLDLEKDAVGDCFNISPDSIKPEISIISNEEIGTTRLCAEFSHTQDLPDEINIVLKAGIADDKGAKLKEDISIALKREKLVETHISLRNDPTINSDTGFDFNTYILDEKDKYFDISFNMPMNRESVEQAFIDGFRYVPEEFMAKVEVDWKDDSNLTVIFKNMNVGQSYPISFNGAKAITGEEYKEFELNKVFGFLVQNSRKISKVDGKGNIVSDMPIEDEILELDEISPDGRYAFAYRMLDTGGDFYPIKPILLELKDRTTEKHYLKGIDYIKGVIFGAKWFPDGKDFIIYSSKQIWHYSLEEALSGKPGKIIFQYSPSEMDYILGAEISPDGNQIAVFKSEYKYLDDKENKRIDIYCIDPNGNNIDTIEGAFYHSSSDGFAIPLKYDWKDKNTIISEGYSQENDEVNIYSIDLKDKKASIIVEHASNPSLLGDILIVRKAEYDKEGHYMAYGDGHVINMKNNNIEDVIAGNLSYSVYSLEGNNIIAYELYEDYYNTYIYDRTKDKIIKKYQGMIFGSDKEYFYIVR
ncbi:MAG: hypothetical protein GX201_05595 [Clostridiales bacterium]|nr:hypothetical protein [Clostridiales bacterium]